MCYTEEEGEGVLNSPYGNVSLPDFTNESLCEFLLKKAEENVRNGRLSWMTNTLTGENLTFADIGPMSRKIASALKKRGFEKGDIVVYLTMDVTKIYAVMMGVWRLGGCLHSSYPEDSAETLLPRLQETKAKFIFCDPSCTPQSLEAAGQVNWPIEVFTFGNMDRCTPVDTLLEDDGNDCPTHVDTKLDDPLIILCTSGTTGKSKGAIYTNRSILSFCLITDAIPWSPKPALYLFRCTHVLGVLFPIRNISTGVWAIMMHQVTKENVFSAVDEYKPFLAFGFPAYLMAIATDPGAEKIDRSSLEIMCTGGMLISSQMYDILYTIPNVKAVLNGLGMTECGGITTTVDLNWSHGIRSVPNTPPLSVGRLYPNTSLKVLDLTTGKPLGPNEKGELTIKSPVMCIGYLNRHEESELAFKDGWMRTGDLGYYDKDGFVFIVDRVKDTFKYYNNHISPGDLEEILLKHPAVAEASVFGIRDPEGGDHIPRAVVTLKSNVSAQSDEIRAFVDEKVESYKKIRGGVFIVPSLPVGKTGKVMRSMVANMHLISNSN